MKFIKISSFQKIIIDVKHFIPAIVCFLCVDQDHQSPIPTGDGKLFLNKRAAAKIKTPMNSKRECYDGNLKK